MLEKAHTERSTPKEEWMAVYRSKIMPFLRYLKRTQLFCITRSLSSSRTLELYPLFGNVDFSKFGFTSFIHQFEIVSLGTLMAWSLL